MGFVWFYGSGKDIVKSTNNVMKGPTVVDFSKALIQPNPSSNIQSKLF